MKKLNTNKKGFTIIEVVLVLAIAGLIFMMVFIALPALQRSQRDTQRANDIARVQTALNQYQANNRGAIPKVGTYIGGHEESTVTATKSNVDTWLYFYDSYIIVNSGGAQDVFADPDGGYYSLWIQECQTTQKATKPGESDVTSADGSCLNGQRYDISFDVQSAGTLPSEPAPDKNGSNATTGEKGHSISVLTHATCRGEVAYHSTGSRKVALVYKKEGGGTICLNN